MVVVKNEERGQATGGGGGSSTPTGPPRRPYPPRVPAAAHAAGGGHGRGAEAGGLHRHPPQLRLPAVCGACHHIGRRSMRPAEPQQGRRGAAPAGGLAAGGRIRREAAGAVASVVAVSPSAGRWPVTPLPRL